MRLSGLQIFWLLFTFTAGNTILLTITKSAAEAKQDAWISFLLAGLLGSLIAWISSKVGAMHANQTFLEYSRSVLGRWIGTVVFISFLIQWYTVIGIILVEVANFAITILLPTTPTWMFYSSILLLGAYVLYSNGIESIGRCSEVFGPIVFVIMLLMVLLLLPVMDFLKLLPVFSDSGIIGIAKGTLMPLSFFAESALMLAIPAFSDHPEKVPKYAARGLLLSTGLVLLLVLSVTMTLSATITAKQNYPAFDAISFINVMNFIQNLEIVAILIWILSVFVKITVYLFLASYGTAKLFGIKRWRRMMWFVFPIAFTIAMIFEQVNNINFELNMHYWVGVALPVNMAGIPLLLWIVSLVRKKGGKSSYG